MNLTTRRVFALALLACVLAIVVHPMVDLPETALRSKGNVTLLFSALVVAIFSSGLLFSRVLQHLATSFSPHPLDSAPPTLSSLRC